MNELWRERFRDYGEGALVGLVILVLGLLFGTYLQNVTSSAVEDAFVQHERATEWSQVLDDQPELQTEGPSIQYVMPFYSTQLQAVYIDPDQWVHNRVAITGLTPGGTFSVQFTYEYCAWHGGPGGRADGTGFAIYSWTDAPAAYGYPSPGVLCVTDDTTGLTVKVYPPAYGK